MKHLLIAALHRVVGEEDEELLSIFKLESVRSKLAKAAQKEYDQWEQDESGYDEHVGYGGICQEIARAMGEEIPDGFDYVEISSDHEVHVWVAVLAEEGVFRLDIPHGVYETGGGYNWTKIPDVTFKPSDIIIDQIASVDEWENYTEEY